MILDLLLVFLDLHEVLLLALLHLEGVHVASDLVLQVAPLCVHVVPDRLFHLQALHPPNVLLFFLLALTLLSLGLNFHVALASTKNIVGALLGLVEFLPRLRIDSVV